MRALLPTAVILTIVVCAGCSRGVPDSVRAEGSVATGAKSITVSTAKAQERDLTDRLELAGSLTPDEQVTVYAKLSGYLKSIRVDLGDPVRPGQLLAELEAPEMTSALDEKRAALLKAQASLEQARAAVEATRAEAEFAQVNYQRLKRIHDRDADVLPGQDVDQAHAGQGVAAGKLKNAEAQVKVAEAAVASAQAEIRTLETMLAYARIEAPLAGVVTQRFVDPGALIQTASSSRTQAAPIVTIARIDRLRAIVDVPEPSAPLVHRGNPATLLAGGLSIPVQVVRTADVLDPASRTLRAEIDVPNGGRRLRPGMTVNVSLELRKTKGAVTVPVAAIHAERTNRTVFVVVNGKARLTTVKTGTESPEWVQIVAGLHGGEDVVVAAAGALTDGSLVSVRP